MTVENLDKRRQKKEAIEENLALQRLMHEMDIAKQNHQPSVEIATTVVATHRGDWKKFDNMATMRKLMKNKK